MYPLLRRRGFSMIEVAITMALVAILLFTVMPDVTAMVANNRIRAAAESYMQGLQRARNDALRTNQNVTFWLTTPNASGVLDNTCALSSSARGWVVSVANPTSQCAAASGASAPQISERAVGGATGGNVVVLAVQSDGSTAATSATFDGFGRVSGASQLQTVCLRNATAGNNFRPLRIEVLPGGVIRLCEPRVTNANDPRICQVATAATCT